MEMSFRQRQNMYAQQAPHILDAVSGNTPAAPLSCKDISTVVMERIVKLNSYRSAEDTVTDKLRCDSFIESFTSLRCAFSILHVFKGRKVSLYIATQNPSEHLYGALPGIKVEKIQDRRCVLKNYNYCGIISGKSNSRIDADKFIEKAITADGMLMSVFVPVGTDMLIREESHINELIQRYSPLEVNDIKSYRGDFRVVNPHIEKLNKLLRMVGDRVFSSINSGMYLCSTFCFSDSREGVYTLAGSYLSSADKDTLIDNSLTDEFYGKNFHITDAVSGGEFCVVKPDIHNGFSVLGNKYLSDIMPSEIVSVVSLPVYTHNGFTVEKSGRGADEYHTFNVNVKNNIPCLKNEIVIGDIIGGTDKFSFDMNMAASHILNCGATGFGKSNTGKRIINELIKKDVPVLILESKKRDYWKLAVSAGGRVYSASNDAQNMSFNPLIPQPGTVIANHIEKLMVSFSSQSTNFESPLPEVLKGLLETTYNKAGFDVVETATRREQRKYPTVNNLFSNMQEYIEELPYSRRVKDDVYGALKIRLWELSHGLGGKIFNTENCINFDEMFSHPVTVIELDSLEEKTCNFAVSVLCCMLDEYLRMRPQSSELKRMVVLEEAHRFFCNTENMNTSNDTRCSVSAFFSEMLCTIRSYGTGMMIIDQRPSLLDRSAISNTRVKIVHALTDRNDVAAIEYHLSLSESQKVVFTNLSEGTAAVRITGRGDSCLVKIDRANEYVVYPVHACMFCNRDKCMFAAMTDIFITSCFRTMQKSIALQLRDDGDIDYVINTIIRYASEYYDRDKVNKREFLTCFAGMLLNCPDVINEPLLRRTMKEFVRRL